MVNYQPLPEEHRNRIAALVVAKKGKSAAARLLGCNRSTVRSALSSQPMHPWMLDRIAKAIAERDREGKNP